MDYGFSVSFRAALKVCPALSGDHEHGFYVNLDPKQTKECYEADNLTTRIMGIWADSNVDSLSRPEDLLLDHCEKKSAGNKRREALTIRLLAFRGHRSVSCERALGDSIIEVVVVTQAGKSPVGKIASINYVATLRTTVDKIDKDLGHFVSMVKSVRFNNPG